MENLPRTHDAMQLRETKRQADAAWASVWIATFGVCTAVTAAYYAKGAYDTAQTQLAESRSPIADRPFVLAKPGIANQQEWRLGTSPLKWPYVLINYGKTPAIIKNVSGVASITDVTPPFPQKSYQDAEKAGTILPPNIIVRDISVIPGTALSSGSNSETFYADGDHSPLLIGGMPPEVAAT